MILPGSYLNFSRDSLPQIDERWTKAFLNELDDEGIDYEFKSYVAHDLKPSQSDKEYDVDKVLNMSSSKPIIISADCYILDGHHRWLNQLVKNPNKKIKVIQIDLPIVELLARARRFKRVEYRKVVESVKKVVRRHYLNG